MAHVRHYWDAPTIPATCPPSTTVVIRSRCGLKLQEPAWKVREWEGKAVNTPADNDCETCRTAPAPRVDVSL